MEKSADRLEVFGNKGRFVFNLERLNELHFFSLEDTVEEQGFTTSLVTEGNHPYINPWWPPGTLLAGNTPLCISFHI
ncbi:MAG: hypothetical protein AAGA86_01170 [Bacteroidota bacterium]